MALNKIIVVVFTFISFNSFGFSFKPFKDYLRGDNSDELIENISSFKPKKVSKALIKMSMSNSIKNKRKTIQRFQELLTVIEDNFDDDELLDVVDELNQKITDRIEYLDKSEKSFFPYMSLQYNSWQDSYTVRSLVSNNETQYDSMNRGPCVGGGMEYGNLFYRFSAEVCAGALLVFSNTSDGGSGVDTIYIKAQTGVSYFLGSKSRLGLNVSSIYRISDYPVPGLSELNGTTYLNVGANLSYQFEVYNNIYFFSSFGGFLSSGALAWNNGINVVF